MKNNVIEESLMEYTKQRFVAVLDIMGFKKIVESNQASVIYDQLKNIFDMAFESQKYFKLHFSIFSDSIFLITDDDSQKSFEDIVIVAIDDASYEYILDNKKESLTEAEIIEYEEPDELFDDTTEKVPVKRINENTVIDLKTGEVIIETTQNQEEYICYIKFWLKNNGE